MAKTKDASTAIIAGLRKCVKQNALDGRQHPGVDSRKRKIFNANRYKSLFTPQRIRIESDVYMEKQVGGECSASNRNADYDACAHNDNHIFHTSSSRHDIANQQELDPCDKVTGTCEAAGANVHNYGKFVEFWVPVQLSNVQLEQYCATLLSNATALCCGLKDTVGGALYDIFVSNRKCCNHPYVVDPTLHSKILKNQEPTMLKLDADIKASGKLQFLDHVLPEIKKRSLRVLILFQSATVTRKGVHSVGDMLFDFVQQRFGEDSYECVLTGLQSSKRQTAVNKFNKDLTIPFFLLDHRACHPSIKLTSIDIIFIFDSDLTPANDLKSLQKISVDSHLEQIMIFRLYSSSTLEEKILKLADTNESRLHNVRSRYDALLMWGASDLFDRLTEFHRGSVFGISFEESYLKDVVEEFLNLISNKFEGNGKSKSIITCVQKFGVSGNNETKNQLPDSDQPHIIWKKLLEGRYPNWKFVPFSTDGQRKRTRHLDGATKGTSTEDGGRVKIRRTTVNPVIETVTGNLNKGAVQFQSTANMKSSHKNTRTRGEKGRFSVQKIYTSQNSSTPKSATVDNDKCLHDLLKATMFDLFNVLKLSDDVKITVEKFLEFVLENYRLSNEHRSKLQALMISMCWMCSALQNINIDRLKSFNIAKKHLKFICHIEEAYSVYGKLQPVKKSFLQTERPASKESIFSPKRAKLDTEKSQRTLSYRKEINKFLRKWEEQRVSLENNYRTDQARIRSMHRKSSVKSEKLTKLKESFVKKLKKHKKKREVYLKEKASQLRVNGGQSLHGPNDNSPEVGPSHYEPVDHINVAEGNLTLEKQVTDAVVSSVPIGEVSTQHHDDIEHHNEAGSIDEGSYGGEDRIDLRSFSSNLASTNSSPEVIILETENESLQGQPFPHRENQDNEPNSLSEIDVECRPSLDAGQLGQIILEVSSPGEPTSPVTAEIQNPNTSSFTSNMYDYVNHAGLQTPNHATPLEAEEARLRLAMDDVVKLHEETEERLNFDCEEEITKMCAEISLKYEAKCQEEEAAFQLKKKEIDANVKRATKNIILAAAFRSKCQQLALSGNAGKYQGLQTELMQQLNRSSGSSLVRCSLGTDSTSSGQSSCSHPTTSPPLSTMVSTSPPPPTSTPLALQSQPPLQIVYQPADLFSSQPPPITNRPSIPLTTTTTTRLPPVIIPITTSATSNTAANQGQASHIRPLVTNGEVCLPASHMRTLPRSDICSPAPH